MKTIQKIALSTLLALGLNTQLSAAQNGGNFIVEVDTYGDMGAFASALTNAHNFTKKGAGALDMSSGATADIDGALTIAGELRLRHEAYGAPSSVSLVNESVLGGAASHKAALVLSGAGFSGEVLNSVIVNVNHTNDFTGVLGLNGTGQMSLTGTPTFSSDGQLNGQGQPMYIPLLDVEGNPVLDVEGNPTYSQDKVAVTGSILAFTALQAGGTLLSGGGHLEADSFLLAADLSGYTACALQVGLPAVAEVLDGETIVTPAVAAVPGYLIVGNDNGSGTVYHTPAGQDLTVVDGTLEVLGAAADASVPSNVIVKGLGVLAIDKYVVTSGGTSTDTDKTVADNASGDPFRNGSAVFHSGATLRLGNKVTWAGAIAVQA